MNSLDLIYTPGVCVFPARSGFTPGWVYVHVVSGAACLICPKLGTFVAGFCCVLRCNSRPHSQNTMSHCWECNLLFVGTSIYSLKKLWYTIVEFSMVFWLRIFLLICCAFFLLIVPGCTLWFSENHRGAFLGTLIISSNIFVYYKYSLI